MPSSLNVTSLVLLPNRSEAEEIMEFGPTSYINTIYKLNTRLLTAKLNSILPDLFFSNQIAFVKDRLLLENVLLASEILEGYHKGNIHSRITLKVDIFKAFDSIREIFFCPLFKLIMFQ